MFWGTLVLKLEVFFISGIQVLIKANFDFDICVLLSSNTIESNFGWSSAYPAKTMTKCTLYGLPKSISMKAFFVQLSLIASVFILSPSDNFCDRDFVSQNLALLLKPIFTVRVSVI